MTLNRLKTFISAHNVIGIMIRELKLDWSIFANLTFDHFDPNGPRLTFEPMKWVKGLKLMQIYKSYGHAM